MIRVLLADDQALVRAGFRLILDAEPDMEVVGEAGDGAEVIEKARSTNPDVVLMDVRMPKLDGIEATRRLLTTGDGLRVLMLTTFDLDEYVIDAFRAGASGFLLKTAPPDQPPPCAPCVRARRCSHPRAPDASSSSSPTHQQRRPRSTN